MLVCQCNVIGQAEIEDVIRGLLAEDEWRLIVPLQVYHAMRKRGRCCGCFPNVVGIIQRVTEAWHRERATPSAEVISLVERLRREHARLEEGRIDARARLRASRAAA